MKIQFVLFGAGLLGMAGAALSQASVKVGALKSFLAGTSQWCLKKQGEILHAEFSSESETATH